MLRSNRLAVRQIRDLKDTDASLQSDREHVRHFERVTGGFLPYAVDTNMAGLDQRSSLGTSFDHPRMPQPFIETLALQHTQRVTPIAKPRR